MNKRKPAMLFHVLLPVLLLVLTISTSLPEKLIFTGSALAFPRESAAVFYALHKDKPHSDAVYEPEGPDLLLPEEAPSSPEIQPAPLLEEKDRGGRIYAETLKFSPSKTCLSIGAGLLRNDTSLPAEEVLKLAALKPECTIQVGGKEPQVLIFHTHTTESFDLYNCGYFKKGSSARSRNKKESVVAVGDAICSALRKEGIACIHDTDYYDSPAFNGCYQRSGKAVQAWLKQYPSISVVLDIHRDAAYANDGGWRKFTCSVHGKEAAQVMIVSGCENGTLGNPNWRHNLRLAALLQNQLEEDHKGLARPLYFCYRNYNQHLSKGALLIEIGTHGNALSEAVYSGSLLGQSLGRALKKLAG